MKTLDHWSQAAAPWHGDTPARADSPGTIHTRVGHAEASPGYRDKSIQLFRKRHILSLARHQLSVEALGIWATDVLSVQRAIYDIDTYYERTPVIDAVVEAPLWRNVERCLMAVSFTAPPEAWSALTDLHRYADAERRIHNFNPLDTREYASILRLKCSDVRIARELVWAHSAYQPDSRERTFWNLYDQSSELIEDLEDLHEDGRDWNFNFWLYSFMAGDAADRSIAAAGGLLFLRLAELVDAYSCLSGRSVQHCRVAFRAIVAAADTIGRLRRRVFSMIAGGEVLTFARQGAANLRGPVVLAPLARPTSVSLCPKP